MYQEPQTQQDSLSPQPPVKKSNKAAKTIGVILLVLVLLAATAVGVYMWKQNELNAQKSDFAKELAEAKASKNSEDASSPTADRPAHEQAPAKKEVLTTCNADELTLSLADGDGGGAGTSNQLVVLTNSGTRTCILEGFPGVSLVNDNGNQIGSPAVRATNYSEKTLTLKPKDEAKATVSFEDESNFDAGKCKAGATKLRVYPPNDTGYLSIESPLITAWCPGFNISPVQ